MLKLFLQITKINKHNYKQYHFTACTHNVCTVLMNDHTEFVQFGTIVQSHFLCVGSVTVVLIDLNTYTDVSFQSIVFLFEKRLTKLMH